MTRWFNKRWVWAALAGATVTVGVAASRGAAQGPPKPGAVITLNIDGKGERQFKVIKSEKQPDGTYLSELKDTQNGETITLVDKPGDAPPASPAAPGGASKTPEPPKGKQRANDPLLPPVKSALPDPPKEKDKEKEKERRPILGRIFGDRDKDKTPPPGMPGTTANTDADSGKKPGLLSRVFGHKKPTGPSMPSATAPSAGPVLKPGSSAPPSVVPTPPGGLSGSAPPALTPTTPSAKPLPPFPNTTPEPPRVMPNTKPVTPPTATAPSPVAPPVASAPAAPAKPLPPFPDTKPAPAPLPIPTPPPPVAAPKPTPTPPPPVAAPTPVPAVPAPTPAPLPPVPAVPSIPVPPAGGGLPPIPVPPGGTSMARPIQVVVPAGYVPAGVAFDRDVQPFVIALQSMSAPSARLTAAKGLADGRHRSTEGVKTVLFQAAQMDPCGEVRAACITHLCELGYFNPHFLGYIESACNDTDPFVRDAAKNACAKMIRK